MPIEKLGPTGFHYCWIIVFIAVLTVFGSLGLGRLCYTIILPEMQKYLELNNTETGILATFNLVSYLIFSAIGGALGTKYGPRIVIAIGLGLCGLGMLMTGTVKDLVWGTIWCSLTGIGSGMSMMPVMGLLSIWFTSSKALILLVFFGIKGF